MFPAYSCPLDDCMGYKNGLFKIWSRSENILERKLHAGNLKRKLIEAYEAMPSDYVFIDKVSLKLKFNSIRFGEGIYLDY